MDTTFENIVPWNGSNDTGLDVRKKMERNFDKVKQNFAELSDLFEKVNIGTASVPVYAIRVKYDFFSLGAISAYGPSASSSSGSGGIDETTLWSIMGNTGSQQIAANHLATALSPYVTQSVMSAALINYAPINHGHVWGDITDRPSSLPASDVYAWAKAISKPTYAFSEITDKPSTLGGYGITDAAAKSHSHVWADITDRPTKLSQFTNDMISAWALAASKPSYSYAEISGTPDLSSLHTHSNKDLLDAINQNLSSTGSPIFSKITIGAICLAFDSVNNSLYVQKSDGTSANFYATGGVSSYGAGSSSGTGSGIDETTLWSIMGNTGTQQIAANHLATALSPYITQTSLSTLLDGYSKVGHGHVWGDITDRPSSLPASDVYAWAKAISKPTYAFSEITDKPSTLGGYGITDAASASALANYLPLSGGTVTGQVIFDKTNDNAIKVGTIRGSSVGSVGGEYIHLYERVHIGSPNGWGSCNAPSYGLSTYGGVQFNVGNVSGAPFIFGGNQVWHEGNDGAGSGLDADMLDGYQWQNILERTCSGVSYSGSSVGWFRIGYFNRNDDAGANTILHIARSYYYTNNEAYSFSISQAYSGGINITQLSGFANNRLITKIRLDWTATGTTYIDLYIGASTTENGYVWTTIGNGVSYTSWIANPTLVGTAYEFTTVTGTKSDRGFTGDIAGNADTATRLYTPRSFTIGNTAKSFDGTGNVSWSLSEIGAAAAIHSHTISQITDIGNASVNYAASAGNADKLNGYNSGFSNGKILRLIDFPHFTYFGSSTDNSDYYRNILKWMYNNANDGDKTLAIGVGRPNSAGNLQVQLYGADGFDATTLYPRYSSAVYYPFGGHPVCFGTIDYNYYEGTLAYLTDNVASATKLNTARSIFGQNFDGTRDINGTLSLNGNGDGNWTENIRLHEAANGWTTLIFCGSDNTGDAGTSAKSWSFHTHQNTFRLGHNDADGNVLFVDSNNNIGIGNTSPAYKLHVSGTGYFSDSLNLAATLSAAGLINANGNIKTNNYIEIGSTGIRIMYDSTNDCLKLIKSDGSAVNLLVTGGVTALATA